LEELISQEDLDIVCNIVINNVNQLKQ